jgi:hypothetical protein
MDDIAVLKELNEQFIEACRKGDWGMLQPILSPSFVELHGGTGAITELDAYAEDLKANSIPALEIDQVHVHVDGNTAVVSARTDWGAPDNQGRYADTYEKRDGSWVCTHATIWRVPRQPAR